MNAALSLDDRSVVADLTARDAIASGRRYEGMPVFVVSEGLVYRLVGGTSNFDWVEEGSGVAVPLVVNDLTERDAILVGDRTDGMFVYVVDEGRTFQLVNGLTNFDWQIVPTRDGVIPVADSTARDAINSIYRYEGMLVYQLSDDTTYQLRAGITNAHWTGAFGAALTFTPAFASFIGTSVSSTATTVLLSFANTVVNSLNIARTSATRITPSVAGTYELVFDISTTSNISTTRNISIQYGVNGVFTTIQTFAQPAGITGEYIINQKCMITIAASDYIEMRVSLSGAPSSTILYNFLSNSASTSGSITIKRVA